MFDSPSSLSIAGREKKGPGGNSVLGKRLFFSDEFDQKFWLSTLSKFVNNLLQTGGSVKSISAQ